MLVSTKSAVSVLFGVVMALSFATSSLAAYTGSYSVIVNGAPIATCSDCTGVDLRPDGTGYAAELHNVATAGIAGASARISGTASGQASISVEFNGYRFTVTPPAPRPNLANGRFVLYMQLDGELLGNATVDAAVQVDVLTLGPITLSTGSAQRSLADQPGGDTLAFEVPVVLGSDFPTTGKIQIEPKLVLRASASIPGGSFQTASANAFDRKLKAVGFRFFNSAGTQVTGFSISGSRAIPELAPAPPAGLARAIEFYNAGFQHYFISVNPAEIAKLDAGSDWARTGESFNVYAAAASGLAGVCRFFGQFPPKSSHFYAPMGLGCEALLPPNPSVWSYEGIVFYTALPDADGGCPAGQVPVYRLYNNGQGGAPNHRFTTNQSVQLDMIAAGYKAEGSGTGVGMCSPL